MIYKTKYGIEIIANVDDEFEDLCCTIKANLPRNKENESTNNGEGVGVRCSLEHLSKASKSECDFYVPVMLLNDSYYWPGLKYKDLILIKFTDNENIRPVAVFDELKYHYGEPISDEEFNELVRKVMLANQGKQMN